MYLVGLLAYCFWSRCICPESMFILIMLFFPLREKGKRMRRVTRVNRMSAIP